MSDFDLNKLRQPHFAPSKRLLAGPGPQNAHPEVHAAMALPQIGHMDPDFIDICEDLKALLRHVWGTENKFTIPISGTGSAAWEAICANIITSRTDGVLVCNNGYFGERAIDMFGRYTDNIHSLNKPYGSTFTPEEIKNKLDTLENIVAVWICHAETSTGTLQPELEKISKICHERSSLVILDTVTSICGVDIQLDAWGIDMAYAGGQKCMGVPPGISAISVNDRALSIMINRKTKTPNWYLDLSMLAKYLVSSDGPRAPRVYHHTAPITMVYAMRKALELYVIEGRKNVIQRHWDVMRYFRGKIDSHVDMKCLIGEGYYSNALCTISILNNKIDIPKLIQICREKFNLEIGGGLGELKGKVLRVGLMGYNATMENALFVYSVLAEGIELVKAM